MIQNMSLRENNFHILLSWSKLVFPPLFCKSFLPHLFNCQEFFFVIDGDDDDICCGRYQSFSYHHLWTKTDFFHSKFEDLSINFHLRFSYDRSFGKENFQLNQNCPTVFWYNFLMILKMVWNETESISNSNSES